ncbi:MAG: hypothetical protein FJ290_06265 [Planctomycetes bacterium]|nr:hypothetical protein [Planctomycetota bacterium]
MCPLAFTLILSRGYSTAAFVALLLVCLGLIVYFYINNARSLPRWYFAILLAMRVLIVVVLLLFIFQPELLFKRFFTSSPQMLVLVDTSGSMGHADPSPGGPPEPRLELAKTNLRGKFLSTLEQQFSVSLYKFGASCQPISYREVRTLRADQELTDLANACATAVNEARQRRGRIAGLVLLTDGIDNSGRRTIEDVAALGIPVYPVGFGIHMEDDKDFKNVGIVSVQHDEFVAKDNTTEIKVLVDSQGYGARPVQVLFVGKDKDKPLATAELVLDTKKGAQSVVLRYTPKEAGRVDGAIEIPKLEDETRLADNRKPITINVTGPRIKALYIEGVLREEGKWLMRNLQTDPNIDLLYLVRSKEGHFLQRGNIKGITLTSIPTSLETWKRFDVLILGDVHSSLFTKNQMLDLKEAVKDDRGLLLMGGVAALGPGKYAGTPVEEVSPVYFGPATIGQENDEFSWELTDDGQVHPIFSNITEFFPTRGGVAEQPMQKLAGCTRVGAAKPQASVLARHPTAKGPDGKPLPVVAAFDVAGVRSLLVTADTTHRWYLPNRALVREQPYVKFWGQAIRWLASEEVKRDDKPGLTAYTDKSEYEPGEKVRFLAVVRDTQGQATGDATVLVSVIGPAKERTKLDLPKLDGRLGDYELKYAPQTHGPHEAIFEARLADQPLGKPQSVKFTVGKPDIEMAELSLNDKLLKELADRTGGMYSSWLLLNELAGGLAAEQERRTEPVKVPLHHAPTFFLFFVAMAAVEWFMRKRIQLA